MTTEAGSGDREIERSFLVANVPDDLGAASIIEQCYVAVDGDVELRVRRRDGSCTLTVKGGHGRERTEIELDIDDARYEALARLAGDRTIEKRRYELTLGSDGLIAEIDRFDGDLAGLDLVEVEFTDSDVADRFDPPAWFGEEVTDVAGYANADLAKHGLPER